MQCNNEINHKLNSNLDAYNYSFTSANLDREYFVYSGSSNAISPKYKRCPVPWFKTKDTKYAGVDGDSVLGWTIPREFLVLHEDVINKVAYFERRDPKEVEHETFVHEIMHNINPYASEAANRAATASYLSSQGKKLTSLHSSYCC